MSQEKFIMFRNRLRKVNHHLSRQAKRMNVSCYRVYDHDLPEFPFCIEVYEDKLYVAEYKRKHRLNEEQHEEWLRQSLDVIGEVFQIAMENIFMKLRQRKAGRLGQYQKLGKQKHEFVVHENRLKFIINLSDYLDTGLFLDHRITRQMVKETSKEKRILNLFSYTAAFSVYAASGRAEEVVSVDLSKTYLSWARRNMELNGFRDEAKYKYIHADAKQYLKTVPKDYFDIAVMDPPTFSNSKRMREFLDIQNDHVDLINDCMSGLKANGDLYFSTNNRKFILDEHKIKAASINDITKATTPFDFEGRLHRQCYRLEK